jgi:hypothetical protein
MFEAVGLDKDYDATFFDAQNDARFAPIPPTTWAELRQWKRVKLVNDGLDYRLTGSGWLEGLKAAGLEASDDVKKRCIELAKAIKKSVDRYSHTDSIVALDELAQVSGTSSGWCFNALQSGLLSARFATKQMAVRIEYPLVYVPPTFGQSRIQMFDGNTSS